jgi:hypothetical protein
LMSSDSLETAVMVRSSENVYNPGFACILNGML